MKTKFRIDYLDDIYELEVLKETDKTITYIDKGNRQSREYKQSHWANWFETRSDAVDYLRIKYEKEITSVEGRLYSLKQRLENLK